MPKYIIKETDGSLHVVGAVGFVPQGALCLAPVAADFDDGQHIAVTGDDASGYVPTFDAAASAARKAAEQAARVASRAQEQADLDILKTLLAKDAAMTAAELKTAVIGLLKRLAK